VVRTTPPVGCSEYFFEEAMKLPSSSSSLFFRRDFLLFSRVHALVSWSFEIRFYCPSLKDGVFSSPTSDPLFPFLRVPAFDFWNQENTTADNTPQMARLFEGAWVKEILR
ncbi:unnamed protein product, partial [Citrullus colocynthis]